MFRQLLLLGALLLAVVWTVPASAKPSAVALEARLWAPCCWQGTLDTHDSELAHELRREIETRLDRGESADAIQADFVARYGERVLAARSAAPISAMTLALTAAFGLAGVGLLAFVLRLVRRSRDVPPVAPMVAASPVAESALDARLDAELADMD